MYIYIYIYICICIYLFISIYICIYTHTHTHLHLCTYICLAFNRKDNDGKVNSHNNIINKNSNDNQFISKLNYPIHSCSLMYNNECKSC